MEIDRNGEELSVMEAVDVLTNMSEIDVKNFINGEEDVTETEELSKEINWKDPRIALQNEPIIKEAFRVLHRYLQNMVRRDQNILNDTKAMKGVQAIILLAQEAVTKMDRFVNLYPDQFKPISKLKEYTDLLKYYKQQILKQMPNQPEIPESWEEGLEEENFKGADAEKKGLRDVEAVRKDLHYELFFIKNQNDKTYFSRDLLRHIRLIGNFDEVVFKVEGDDPILAFREVLDTELFEGAKEIMRLVAPYLDEFYKESMKRKDVPFIGSMNNALMALRMSANAKNLIENQSFKSCLEYYADFHRFLRYAMNCPGYQKRISKEIKEDHLGHVLLRLTHALCFYYFQRVEPKREGFKLIEKMIERGDKIRGPRKIEKAGEKELQFWKNRLDEDESIRTLLSHYPNGPTLRILDSFRQEEEFEGFDPLLQGNFPSLLFNVSDEKMHLTVLRLPCPTKQVYINRADPTEEFKGLLRFYKTEMKLAKHLIVNLQNISSWEEHARCQTLEAMPKQAEFFNSLFLLGLEKNSSFYLQNDEYQTMSGAPVFMEKFQEQLMSRNECGFSFPESLKALELSDFIQEGLTKTHELFFEKKSNLTRDERLNFIEIFYLLLIYKMVDLYEIDSISFTCKDAIDTGMMQSVEFYGFTKIVSDPKSWGDSDRENLIWMLYSPALFVRDRIMNELRFKRAISALEQVHLGCLKHGAEVAKELSNLYKKVKFPLNVKIPKG